MKINLVEAWKKVDDVVCENSYKKSIDKLFDIFEKFLREQESRLQREHDQAVAEEVIKVLDEIMERIDCNIKTYEDKNGIAIDIDVFTEIRARYDMTIQKCKHANGYWTQNLSGEYLWYCQDCKRYTRRMK